MIFFYIYVFLFAVISLFFPKTIWKMRHWFSVKNGEPSEGYLIITRISGAVLLLGLICHLFFSNHLY